MLRQNRVQYAAVMCFVSLFAQNSGAQLASLRGADTRTYTPEAVKAERKQWGADLGFGGNFTRGNTDVNYLNASFSVFRTKDPSTAYLSGHLISNAYGHVRVLNQGALTARYDYSVSGSWKIFVYNTNAYNQFLRLDHRMTTGIGPWRAVELGASRHGLSVAVTHEYENFKGDITERASRISFRDVSSIPISRTAELRADMYYVPKIDAMSDYHVFVQVDLQTIIWKDNLGLKLSWIDEHDSRPKPGVRKNDTVWLTSLTLHFGE